MYLITEREADAKWCPMSRFHDGNGEIHHNKPSRIDPESPRAGTSTRAGKTSALCISWRCMCWVPERMGNDKTGKGRCGLVQLADLEAVS